LLPQSIWRRVVTLFRHDHNPRLVASLTAFNEPRIYLSSDVSPPPALRIAGALFLIIYLLAGAYVFRHRRRLFGRDPRVDGDNEATRHVRIEVILTVWLGLTTLIVVEWVRLWIN